MYALTVKTLTKKLERNTSMAAAGAHTTYEAQLVLRCRVYRCV